MTNRIKLEKMKKELPGIYTKRDDYYVSATIQKEGEIYNFLEECTYELDDERCIVIEGTIREKWPVNLETLRKTYELDEKALQELLSGETVKVHPKKISDRFRCFECEEETEIKTSYGDILKAHPGDIVAYEIAYQGNYDATYGRVINKDVFKKTYKKV